MKKLILICLITLTYITNAYTQTTTKTFKDGEYKDYYKNGQLSCKRKYLNNKREGEWVFYTQIGKKMRKENYLKGKKHGEYINYGHGDNIQERGNYVNGKVDGDWIDYKPDGSISRITKVKNGEKVEVQNFVNGVLVKEDLIIEK